MIPPPYSLMSDLFMRPEANTNSEASPLVKGMTYFSLQLLLTTTGCSSFKLLQEANTGIIPRGFAGISATLATRYMVNSMQCNAARLGSGSRGAYEDNISPYFLPLFAGTLDILLMQPSRIKRTWQLQNANPWVSFKENPSLWIKQVKLGAPIHFASGVLTAYSALSLQPLFKKHYDTFLPAEGASAASALSCGFINTSFTALPDLAAKKQVTFAAKGISVSFQETVKITLKTPELLMKSIPYDSVCLAIAFYAIKKSEELTREYAPYIEEYLQKGVTLFSTVLENTENCEKTYLERTFLAT